MIVVAYLKQTKTIGLDLVWRVARAGEGRGNKKQCPSFLAIFYGENDDDDERVSEREDETGAA